MQSCSIQNTPHVTCKQWNSFSGSTNLHFALEVVFDIGWFQGPVVALHDKTESTTGGVLKKRCS